MSKAQAETHAIIRTSPTGQPFVGTCSLCGQTGLRMRDMEQPCFNMRGLSDDEAVIETIENAALAKGSE